MKNVTIIIMKVTNNTPRINPREGEKRILMHDDELIN